VTITQLLSTITIYITASNGWLHGQDTASLLTFLASWTHRVTSPRAHNVYLVTK